MNSIISKANMQSSSDTEAPCDKKLACVLKKRALRDAVICVGWLKLLSVICFALLYFLVHLNSEGHMSTVVRVMILVAVPLQVLHGVLLFLGALEDTLPALEISLWLCLLMGAYTTVLGIMGCVYFIRTGYMAMHFLLAIAFALLALSIFTVLCHDIVIVYSYKQCVLAGCTLSTSSPSLNNSSRDCSESIENRKGQGK